MSRLPAELRRLYLPPGPSGDGSALQAAGLNDAEGRARALVLGVAGPRAWQPLAAVWQGVQADLGLPAPAIAVDGREALQLWFSLAQPVGPAEAQAFVDGLQRRYLGEVPASGVRTLPATPGPALQPDTGVWSAFIAPDLAPVFEETPWLDSPPGDDGQASLLARLQSVPAALFEAALVALAAPPVPTPVAPAVRPAGPAPAPAGAASEEAEQGAQARRFLLGVVNDTTAPLALRIEAARALLPQRPSC